MTDFKFILLKIPIHESALFFPETGSLSSCDSYLLSRGQQSTIISGWQQPSISPCQGELAQCHLVLVWIAKSQQHATKWGCTAGPEGGVSSVSALCLYCLDCQLITQTERSVQKLLYLFFTPRIINHFS